MRSKLFRSSRWLRSKNTQTHVCSVRKDLRRACALGALSKISLAKWAVQLAKPPSLLSNRITITSSSRRLPSKISRRASSHTKRNILLWLRRERTREIRSWSVLTAKALSTLVAWFLTQSGSSNPTLILFRLTLIRLLSPIQTPLRL